LEIADCYENKIAGFILMKIHFYMIVSGKEEIQFQAELFIRSISFNCEITICGEGNSFLRKHADIIPLPKSNLNPSWYAGLGCVPQKGDVTIYADADILLMGRIDHIADTCIKHRGATGVVAYASPKIDWKSLYEKCGVHWPGLKYSHSVEGSPCPFYVNLGFVAVPSSFVPAINEAMLKFIRASNNVYPEHYHRPQFAMCLAIEHLGLPKAELPLKYNCPDLYNKITENAVVAHLLQTKSEMKNWRDLKEFIKKPPRNKVVERVQRRLKLIAI
jgi:hypothetical protein